MSRERDDPRDWVGDFDNREVVDPVTGKRVNVRLIPRFYPSDVSSNTVLGIIGAIVIAIGVYAYMKNNTQQPPMG